MQSRAESPEHLNDRCPYMIFPSSVFWLKISYPANEIYCLTVKTNGDAAPG